MIGSSALLRRLLKLLAWAVVLTQSGQTSFAEEISRTAASASLGSALASVTTLNTHVRLVVTGTTWCDDSLHGSYRVVVWSNGFEEVYDHLYVQILANDEANHDVVIRRTVAIDDTVGLSLFFENISLKASGSGLCNDAIVDGDVTRRTVDGERRERISVRVTPEGDYTVRFTPERRKANSK